MQPLSFFHEAFDAAPVGMLIVDARGSIIEANRHLERLFGYAPGALISQPVECLVDGLAEAHRAHREQYQAKAEPRPMGAGRALFARHREGHRVPVEIGLTPLRTAAGQYVLASVSDLSERQRAQQQLEASVAEKEILLKELHHRAKNNLQLIGSLLDLASARPGPEVLRECRDRINSISLVHEKLYQSGTFARIELRDYLRTLGEQVSHAWRRPDGPPVALRLEADDLWLPLDRAIPCGLVVNELLINAYKHAFPPGHGGTITVRATAQGSKVRLCVEDDGVGLSLDAQLKQGHIGLDLVRALTRQLRGELDSLPVGSGTRVCLTFEGASA